VTKPLKKDATYADLCAVAENFVAEILEGELYAFPRPALPHAHAASVLGGEIMGPFHRGRHGPGGWLILNAPELHLGADVLVPDLAGWRRERMPTIPNVAAFSLAPDWACEVVSASTERHDRGGKMRIYARAGVAHLWLLDPLARSLETYRLEAKRWVAAETHRGDGAIRAAPFDAIALTMRRWWLEG
jgi:Uma2 family endonuclease